MFGTTQRDPMLDLMVQLERRTGRIIPEPFRTFEWPVPEAATAAWLPLVDIFEEPDVIRLVAEETAEKVHRYERTYGAFERTFRLSASIDANRIKATCNLGVLTITLPKAETAKPHLIKVEVTPETALLTA